MSSDMMSWWCGAAVIIAVVSRPAAWSAGSLIYLVGVERVRPAEARAEGATHGTVIC